MKPKAIFELEKKLGFELKDAKDSEGIVNIKKRTYLLNNEHEIIGLYLWSEGLKDISFLQNLRNLRRLDLSYNKIVNISCLQGLRHLEFLDLSGNQITDIAFLHEHRDLVELDLTENIIQDFNPLMSLCKLEAFYANKGNADNDFSFETFGDKKRIILRFSDKIVCGCWAEKQLSNREEPSIKNFYNDVLEKYGDAAKSYCPELWKFLE